MPLSVISRPQKPILNQLTVSEQGDLEDIGGKHVKVQGIQKRIIAAKENLALRRRLYAMSSEELQLIEKENADQVVRLLAHNTWRIKAMREVLDSEAKSVTPELLKQSLAYLPEIKGDFSKQVRKAYKKQLEALLPPTPPVEKKKTQNDIKVLDYRTTILELITRVEGLSEIYAAGLYAECAEHLDVCYFILDEIGTNDENTRLIRTCLDQWRSFLGHPN